MHELEIAEAESSVTFPVRVIPRASKNEIIRLAFLVM